MYTIKQLLDGYEKKEFSPVEITQQYLERAKKHESLNAFVTVTEEIALEQAKIAEQKWQMKENGKLEGIPLSYKDNIYTKNVRTTSASKIDEDFVPKENAVIIDTLNKEGAVMVGKNNMHEFAFGITSNNPFYGPVKNPWNEALISGGSSGGSAVSVATYSSVSSIGTDTGGSIRIPAAMCGLVGFKPTQGLLAKEGFTNISWTLDHSGPITRNLDDLNIMMDALTNGNVAINDAVAEDLRGVKIGVPKSFFNEQIEADVLASYETTLEKLQELGAHLVEVDVPHATDSIPFIFTIAIGEGGYTHRHRKKTAIDNYGEDVRNVMMASDDIPALDYIHALEQKEVITNKVNQLFTEVDFLATPTLPALPKKIGQEEVQFGDVTEPIFDCMIRYASYFNLTGHPAISLPADVVNGLPVGLQLASAKWTDSTLITISKTIENTLLQDFYKVRDEKLRKFE
ncbi:MAG TPA: amidase [Pseudogracilibacillus sp.]|nr:amidase [Pseudogracilibacillus sp.]